MAQLLEQQMEGLLTECAPNARTTKVASPFHMAQLLEQQMESLLTECAQNARTTKVASPFHMAQTARTPNGKSPH
jgi:hypothetical protein